MKRGKSKVVESKKPVYMIYATTNMSFKLIRKMSKFDIKLTFMGVEANWSSIKLCSY